MGWHGTEYTTILYNVYIFNNLRYYNNYIILYKHCTLIENNNINIISFNNIIIEVKQREEKERKTIKEKGRKDEKISEEDRIQRNRTDYNVAYSCMTCKD